MRIRSRGALKEFGMTLSEATALDHLLEKFKGRPFSAAQAARLGIDEKMLRKLVSNQAVCGLARG